MTTMPQGYYNRFDADKNYDEHLFRAGKVLQSAELNEVQSNLGNRVKTIADVLFKDGSIVRDAQILVDVQTGATTLGSGAVYLRGAVRGVAPAELLISVSGRVLVGIYLTEVVVTELEDADLRDPAVGVRNFQEPGASRLQVNTAWGYEGDGQEGEFYAVYEVIDGVVSSKEPPPQIDAISNAIARYDRQSAGGYYMVNGLEVQRLADNIAGSQVYSVAEGVARVDGKEVTVQHAIQAVFATAPDPKSVTLEPHIAQGGTERIDTNHYPIIDVAQVSVIKQKTVTVTHGGYSGVSDALPDSPVVELVSVSQGATTYDIGVMVGGTLTPSDADCYLDDDQINWSPAGDEPATGSTYSVTYNYVTTVTPENPDDTGFDVTGAVSGSLIQVTYTWAMPRIDRLCLTTSGQVTLVEGASSPYTPRTPDVPPGLLGLATVYQWWDARTRVVQDAIKVVPMNELNGMNRKIDSLFALMAEERLVINSLASDPTSKKGVFADAFYDDDLRDQGLEQTAAIFSQVLTLGLDATVYSQTLSGPQVLDARVIIEENLNVGTSEDVVSQLLRTGTMLVNPYQAFSPLPGVAVLTPSVDFWTEIDTVWASPITRVLEENWGSTPAAASWIHSWNLNAVIPWIGRLGIQAYFSLERWIEMHRVVVLREIRRTTETEKLGTTYVDLQYLRQIEVNFALSGLAEGETITDVVFGGNAVDFTAP